MRKTMWRGIRRAGLAVLATAGVSVLSGAAAFAYALAEARRPRIRTTDIHCCADRTGALVNDAQPQTESRPSHRTQQDGAQPSSRKPLTIMQIADTHMHGGSAWMSAFLRQAIDDVQPDLIINTGDNFSTAEGLSFLQSVFSAQAAGRFPGAFVFGSNDYYAAVKKFPAVYIAIRLANIAGLDKLEKRLSPKKKTFKDLPHRDLARAMTQCGYVDLRNESADMRIDMDAKDEDGAARTLRLSFVGVDDPHIGRDILPRPAEGWEDADIRIGVMHAPYARLLDAMCAMGADIVIAGHTHGGQVRVPFYGALVNNCDIPLKFSSGLHRWVRGMVDKPHPKPSSPATDIHSPSRGAQEELPALMTNRCAVGSTWLYVSQGLGTNVHTPIRFACQPTVDVLRVYPPKR